MDITTLCCPGTYSMPCIMPEKIWPMLERSKQSNIGVDNHLETFSGQMKQLHEWPTHYHLYHIIFFICLSYIYIFIYIYNHELYQCLQTHHQSLDESSETTPNCMEFICSNIARRHTINFTCTSSSESVLNAWTIISRIKQLITSQSCPHHQTGRTTRKKFITD